MYYNTSVLDDKGVVIAMYIVYMYIVFYPDYVEWWSDSNLHLVLFTT